MVVRKLRKTLKRSLALAMAAALMVTSVPEFSVTAVAQEEISQEEVSEQTAPAQTDEGAPQDGNTTEVRSAEQDRTPLGHKRPAQSSTRRRTPRRQRAHQTHRA